MTDRELIQLRKLQAKWKQEQRDKKRLREQPELIAELLNENEAFRTKVEERLDVLKKGGPNQAGTTAKAVKPASPVTTMADLEKCKPVKG